MEVEDVAGQAEEPDQQQPGPIIMEIRVRLAKLDLVDEIVGAIHSMHVMVRSVPKQ
jgi:hypothetical protein